MKREWKNVLVKWVCPLAVLLVIIVILFYNFSASMHKGITSTFEQNLVTTVGQYAVRLEREFVKIHTVGNLIADIAFAEGEDQQTIVGLLASAVKETDLYEAVVCDADGNAVNSKGENFSLTDISYYEWCTEAQNYAYCHVENDEMTGEEAMLLTIPSQDGVRRVILYYPMSSVRDFIQMESEFDEDTFAAILDQKGNIVVATDTATPFFDTKAFWANIDTAYRTNVSQIKYMLLDGKSGCEYFGAQGEERAIVYVPVGEWALIVGLDETYAQDMQSLYGKKMTSNLHRMILTVIIGVLVIVAINFITSLSTLKGTKQLKEKADTDQLTGLGNKLATESRIKEYIANNPDSLAVMFVLDIDNFKKINDTMGHAFGDEVMREFGRHIGVNFRVTDIIGRTGGDEFTIFLKNLKDESNAVREAQKLEYFFKHFQVGDYVKYSATASIGAAVFPADGSDFETLYKAADAALYKAKKRGKNRLAFFNEQDKTS